MSTLLALFPFNNNLIHRKAQAFSLPQHKRVTQLKLVMFYSVTEKQDDTTL